VLAWFLILGRGQSTSYKRVGGGSTGKRYSKNCSTTSLVRRKKGEGLEQSIYLIFLPQETTKLKESCNGTGNGWGRNSPTLWFVCQRNPSGPKDHIGQREGEIVIILKRKVKKKEGGKRRCPLFEKGTRKGLSDLPINFPQKKKKKKKESFDNQIRERDLVSNQSS